MPTVLVVDDAAVDRKLVAGLLAKGQDMRVALASSAEEALERLPAICPEIIVTDLVMPGMSGLELVAQVAAKHPEIPVVLMTGKGSEEIAVKALEAGAASYVPKGVMHQHLLNTVQDVLAMVHERHSHARLMCCLKRGQFQFALGNDPSLIPSLINHVQSLVSSVGLCDEASVIRVCIALEEAVRNALFHGNLELTSEQREGDAGEYQRLIDQRSATEPYASRRLEITVEVTPRSGRFVIRDYGPGFDPSKLPDPTDPANLERVSGRGLLLMRTFMDEVTFNATGNQVTMVKRCEAVIPISEARETSDAKFIRAEQCGNVIMITPLFTTYSTLSEPGLDREWSVIDQQLDSDTIKHVVIDLGEVPYFGSTVLEWMSLVWKRVKVKGGKLAIARPSQIGREVLDAARLQRLWKIFDTREEALASFGGTT
jgi:anti-anti-sigma factor